MLRRILFVFLLGLLVETACKVRSGPEVWAFRCDRGANDGASGVVVAAADNITVVGHLGFENSLVLAAVGLSAEGNQKWLFAQDSTHNLPDYLPGRANAVAADAVGNIYIAGSARYSRSGSADFVVVSLTPGGDLRWIYVCPDSVVGSDEGLGIVCGSDGNIYAAGQTSRSPGWAYFTVVSLTADGQERWVYKRNGYTAYVPAWGPDNNLYVVGEGGDELYALVSFTPDGDVRWTRTLGQHGSANAIAFDAAGNVCIGGWIELDSIAIASFTPEGDERWIWRRGYSSGSLAGMCALAGDKQGDVYAAAYVRSDGEAVPESHLTVTRLSPDGEQRWVYRHPATNSGAQGGVVAAIGPDGNFYCAGSPDGYSAEVLSFSPSGDLRFEHRFGCTTWGGSSIGGIAFGPDGRLYVAGSTTGYLTDADFTVVCLEPE